MHNKKLVFSLLALILLAGCAAPASGTDQSPSASQTGTVPPAGINVTPSPALSQTATHVSSKYQSTRTHTPIPTHTPTSRPVFPTSTPGPSSTPEPTRYIDETAMAEAWFKSDQELTQAVSFPISCDEQNRTSLSVSPDENWVAVTCKDRKSSHLEVINRSGKRWILDIEDYQKMREDSWPIGTGPYAGYWSVDKQYLYFFTGNPWDGGGGCFYGFWPLGVFAIELETGIVSPILPATDAFGGYNLEISPDGRLLAYSLHKPFIRDLLTGEEAAIDVGDAVAGDFHWSPDGTELMFTTCDTIVENNWDKFFTTVRIYDRESRTVQTILAGQVDIAQYSLMEVRNSIEISYYNVEKDREIILYYNWSSRQFTITPQP